MPRGRPGPAAAKPHSRKKAARRLLSPDEQWAESIVARVLEACHPKQRAFVLDPGRRVSALCARGAGKTTAGLARFVIRMVRTTKARCLFIAQTKDDARELIWDKLQDWVERFGIEATFVESRLECTFTRNGSKLKLVGADDDREVNKLRGKPRHEVGIDETAVFTAKRLSNLVHRAIGPRLGDYGGCLWMVSTPGHVLAGLYYDATRPGSDKHRPWEDRELPEFANWKRWSSHAWSLQDGAPHVEAIAALWAEALEEKEAEDWSDDNPIWMREYLGLWAADDTENIYRYRAHVDGKPWNQWDPFGKQKLEGTLALRAAIAALPCEFKDWLYAIGFDMGSRDPFAANVIAFSPSDPLRRLFHVHCFGRTKMYAKLIAILLIGEEAVEKVLRSERVDYEKPSGGIFDVIGWPVAMVADLASLGEAIIEELANVYGIRIKAAEKKGKHAAIELTNGDFVDGRWKIIKDSPLEDQLTRLQWIVDEFGQVKENKADRNDHSDSIIYIRREIAVLFAGGTIATDKGADDYVDPMGIAPARGVDDDIDAMIAKEQSKSRGRTRSLTGGISAEDEFSSLPSDPFFAEDDHWNEP